ncbi:glycoside hydrolase domain-containing protein [Alicyclobacillus sp.]|uniref:glycoside hydrolase domain-containing protein n=1 Tax=Alicyclobacillus sp. TaxID=61169 RepID=UPI0025C22F4F|nr:glycoside hydrolase domain-containing protein [Alicyclobacillus sp.]MCL6516937.1 DUF1906 domain-containing protein [Alicyclobacillus sp.]
MNVIARAVDTTVSLSSAQAQALKQSGVAAVGRYLGRKTHGWSKAITPAEARTITDAGLRIFSIWESNPTYAGYFTREQGVSDAQQAVEEARWLGQPGGSAIYFTVDYDVQPGDLSAVSAYLDGVREGLNGQYRLGVYGGIRVINAVTADYYWQTLAWSGGQLSARADLYQIQVDTTLAGIDVDIDNIYQEPGWWTVALYPTIHAEVEGKDMAAIVVNGSTYVLYTALDLLGTPYHLVTTNGRYTGMLNINGVNVQGVIYEGSTYIPWTALAPGIQAQPLPGGGWNFVLPQPPATDVAANDPLAPAVTFALQNRLLSNDATGAFHPQQPVTRGELATALLRLYNVIKFGGG